MSIAKVPRITVTIHRPRNVNGVLAQMNAIRSKIASNPVIFKTPEPPLVTIDAHLADLHTAQVATLTSKGAVPARNAALQIVLQDQHTVSAYVERLANADAANAESIVAAASLAVRKSPVRNKQELTAKQGSVSGCVILEAKAVGRRASYDWQWSLDQKVWTSLPGTLQARTSVTNLGTAVVHYFRVQPRTKAGPADWSQPVSLIVK